VLDLPPLAEPPVLGAPPLAEPPELDTPPLAEPPVLGAPPLAEPPELDVPPLAEPPVLDLPPLPDPPPPPELLLQPAATRARYKGNCASAGKRRHVRAKPRLLFIISAILRALGQGYSCQRIDPFEALAMPE
jgi:hypothetical protein